MMEYTRLTERKTKACTVCRETRTCPQGICWRETIYNRLQELEDKMEQGTLIELPCKVGDTVYVPWIWDGVYGVATVKIEEIKFYDTKMHYMFFIDMDSDDESYNQEFGGWKIDQSIGETVFLTREEAEKRLKELQE